MTPYTKETLISENGTYTLAAQFIGNDYIMYVSGTFGGATATLGYEDASGNYTDFRDSSGTSLTMTSSSGYIVISPPSQTVAVKITNAGESTSVRFDISHRKG
jgi:hypothetical protein